MRTAPLGRSPFHQELHDYGQGKTVSVPTAHTVAPTERSTSSNPLRPNHLAAMIGQDRLRALLRRVIDSTLAKNEPLDHMLLVGQSGCGKTTLANIVANELGVDVYQIEAPVSHETLLDLRVSMKDRDILFIDEIHQQAIAERRGRSTSTQPEVLFDVMENRTLVSGTGVLSFPAITVMGATTDEGMLPDAFINRFPLRPHFDHYLLEDLAEMALLNAHALNLTIQDEAAIRFAYASRGVPRQINNYVRNAAALTTTHITEDVAQEVVEDLNRTTDDGLTLDMQRALIYLVEKCGRLDGGGQLVYQASVGSIATAIGKGRDTKAIALRVEPYLIQEGYLQVGHGGRRLTDAGIARALELSHRAQGMNV